MRFITRILLLGALSLTVPAALLAQRGGVAGAHAGAPAAHAFAGGGSHGFAAAGTPRFGILSPATAGYTGIRPGALRSYGYGSYGYGRGYGRRDFRRVPFGYFFAPYYDPYLGYSDSAFADYGNGPGYVYDPGSDPNVEGAMADQLNRLTAEVEQLKYGQQPAPPPYAAQDSQPAQPSVTLVLRNGQQLKVQNYAVMDQTFWDFSSEPTRKIPLANIDVAASVKATNANGGDFPQLGTSVHDGQ
jgi:hypothetical protein